MKKTLLVYVCFMMAGSAFAATLEWNGGASGAWGTAGNWIDTSTGSAPSSVLSGQLLGEQVGNTYILNGNVNISSGNMFNSGSQTIVIKSGSNIVLSNSTASNSNNRFDGVFRVEEGATLTLGNSYFFGSNQIYGTLILCCQFAPQNNASLDFGLSGIMKLSDSNTYHGVEGNNRTTSISATLNLGIGSSYTVLRRQLFDLNGVTDFNLNKYGGNWKVSAGSILDTNGQTLTAAGSGDLLASADTLGQYKLVLDAQNGLYIDYVAAVPEPATASLGLLGLAAFMMRRRRA